MTNPRVCILVLNWNGADDTLECLASLKQLTYNNAEVVVIDNGSTDDSVSRIRQEFNDIKILELESNLYFGGGNNEGLKWAHTKGFEYCIFLNNDTTVEPDFIEPLIAAFEPKPDIGIVAPLMCYHGDPGRIWYGGGKVNLWTGTIAHRHIREPVSVVGDSALETDYITGCCLMMPTALAMELGGFSPAFQMYGEDVDLSLRCKAKGKELLFVPRSRIYHKVSASVGGEFAFSKLKRKLRGLLQIFARHTKWYQWISIIICQFFYSFQHLITLLNNRKPPGTKPGAES